MCAGLRGTAAWPATPGAGCEEMAETNIRLHARIRTPHAKARRREECREEMIMTLKGYIRRPMIDVKRDGCHVWAPRDTIICVTAGHKTRRSTLPIRSCRPVAFLIDPSQA